MTASTPSNIAVCGVTYTAASGDEGSYSVTATYAPGDSYNLASGPSAAQTITVTTGTGITLACVPPSIDWNGGSSLCSATVTAADAGDKANPTGLIYFYYFGYPIFACAPTPGATMNTASCGIPLVSASGDEGSYAFSAAYTGDSYNGGSGPTDPTSLTVTTGTTTAFSCSGPSSIPNTGSLTGCTVTVTNVDTGYLVPPSGTISFAGSPSDFPSSCALSGSGDTSTCSFDYNPVIGDVGTYSITASFASGDIYHTSSGPSSPPQSLEVLGTTSVGTTLSGATLGGSVPLGSSVGDTATVTFSPSTLAASGDVSFAFYESGSCAGSPIYTGSELLGTDAPAFGPLSPGTYGWTAQYVAGTGDNYVSSPVSPCEAFTVQPGTLDISTSVDPSTSPALGASVSDVAAADSGVVSGFTPSGTLTFTLYSGSTCTESVLDSQAGVPLGTPSNPETSLNAGLYSYSASSYTGDSNYVGSGYSCEPFTVQKASASISTSVNPSTAPSLGAGVTDTATATGIVGFGTPTGTVTITLYPGSSCLGTPLGTYPSVSLGSPSPTVTPALGAGSYSFEASSYSGDSNYQAIAGAAGSCEPFSVQRAQASISTLVQPAVTNLFGAKTFDTAAIGGTVSGFVPTGSVVYSFYTNSACGGAHTTQTVVLSAGVVPQSAPQALAPGTYSFGAAYSGDSNYLGSSGGCEPLYVQTPTLTVVACLPFTGAPGATESCTAQVLNADLLYGVKATGSVSFHGTLPPGMPSGCSLSPGSGILNYCTVTWTPSSGSEGSYSITATYGGDTTHATSSGHASVSIAKRGVTVSLTCNGTFVHNTPISCSVTVTDNSPGSPATPSGLVTFSSSGPGAFSSASCTLSGSGSKATCTVTFTPTTKNSYSIYASYSGDGDHYSGSASFKFKTS